MVRYMCEVKEMTKIDFNKYLNPCDEQEFIELSYEILKEFNINTKVYIDFNEELKYLTLGREAYDEEQEIVYIEFNPRVLDCTKEDKIDTIFHELLHAYIDTNYPNEREDNRLHKGMFEKLREELGVMEI